MIDYEGLRSTVAKGLKDYLKCPIIRSNQNAKPPAYPYGSYTVITPQSQNNGTWQEHEDGVDRKAVTQTWSLSFLSDNNSESVAYASKAHDWFERVGTNYLKANGVIVQSVSGITNRDNVLSVEYEYKNGFDVVFWLYDEIQKNTVESNNIIETVELNGGVSYGD